MQRSICGIGCEKPQDLIIEKSTLVLVKDCSDREQAMAWVNVDLDLCWHMASPAHNELTDFVWTMSNKMTVCTNQQPVTLTTWSRQGMEMISALLAQYHRRILLLTKGSVMWNIGDIFRQCDQAVKWTLSWRCFKTSRHLCYASVIFNCTLIVEGSSLWLELKRLNSMAVLPWIRNVYDRRPLLCCYHYSQLLIQSI